MASDKSVFTDTSDLEVVQFHGSQDGFSGCLKIKRRQGLGDIAYCETSQEYFSNIVVRVSIHTVDYDGMDSKR
jgi:hypothetical protein